MNTQRQFERPNRPSATGFSLPELLIVIAIISVLAAMSVSMLSGASNDAKVSATQARMSQIISILQLKMEDYEVRRLPIPNRVLAAYVAANPMPIPGGNMPSLLQLKYLRRQLMVSLINSEMPRPIRIGGTEGVPITYGHLPSPAVSPELGIFPSEDVLPNIGTLDDESVVFPISGEDTNNFAEWLDANYPTPVDLGAGPISLAALLSQTKPGSVNRWSRFNGNVGNKTASDEILSAEFLHAILAEVDIDGQSAVELLGNSAIDDTDGDGIPEIVDAWGDPMIFDLEQLSALVDPADGSVSTNNAATANPIPLDPRVPRALGDLRFVVGSTRIPESLPTVEQAGLGLLKFARDE